MKSSLTYWLLGGALLASLQANLSTWVGARRAAPTQAPAVQVAADAALGCDSGCGFEEPGCDIRLGSLGLEAEQLRQVERLCCDRGELVGVQEARAAELLDELQDELVAAELDEPRIRELVDEISVARGAALRACVDSVTELRSVLELGQLEVLLESCGTLVQGSGDPGTCGG